MKNLPIEKIRTILSAYKHIKAVFLFGSHASNTNRKDSDVDLAILLEDKTNQKTMQNIKLSLLAEITELGLDKIDLVILNTAPTLLRHTACLPNYTIFERKDFDRGTFMTGVVKEYNDMLPLWEVQNKALKSRYKNGLHTANKKKIRTVRRVSRTSK